MYVSQSDRKRKKDVEEENSDADGTSQETKGQRFGGIVMETDSELEPFGRFFKSVRLQVWSLNRYDWNSNNTFIGI